MSIPIEIGDLIGINCCSGVFGEYFRLGGMGAARQWAPELADGTPRAPTDSNATYEILVNAEIDPTSTFNITAVKPKKGGKVKVTVNLPNPGTFAAGDKGTKLATAAGSGKKTRYLKRKSTLVAAPGQVVLVVKPTKAARQALSPGDRLKARMKLAFTPTGGIASTRLRNVKLKP